MRNSRVVFFAFLIGGLFHLSGYSDASNQVLPKSMDKDGAKKIQGATPKFQAPMKNITEKKSHIETTIMMDSSNRKVQISVRDLDGKTIVAKNNFNQTWTISGNSAIDGMIKIDPKTGNVVYQNSSPSAPVQSMTLDSKGISSITTQTDLGNKKKTVVIDAAGDPILVDVINSPNHKLSARSITEGLWEVSGTNSSGRRVKGTLEIDPETGFVAYKGSNGTFMSPKPIPVDCIIANMSTMKGKLSDQSVEEISLNMDIESQAQPLIDIIISKVVS